MTTPGAQPDPPRSPSEFGWLVNNFAASTPGISHAVIVSSDGLLLFASGSMSADIADPLSAMTSGMISLGNSIANLVGDAGCDGGPGTMLDCSPWRSCSRLK